MDLSSNVVLGCCVKQRSIATETWQDISDAQWQCQSIQHTESGVKWVRRWMGRTWAWYHWFMLLTVTGTIRVLISPVFPASWSFNDASIRVSILLILPKIDIQAHWENCAVWSVHLEVDVPLLNSMGRCIYRQRKCSCATYEPDGDAAIITKFTFHWKTSHFSRFQCMQTKESSR